MLCLAVRQKRQGQTCVSHLTYLHYTACWPKSRTCWPANAKNKHAHSFQILLPDILQKNEHNPIQP